MTVYSLFYFTAFALLVFFIEKRKRHFDKNDSWRDKNKITYY
jgi:hypothetical protein